MYDDNQNEIDPSQVAVIGGGNVEYSLTEAAVEIQVMIDMLLDAKEEGARYVVASSGNYRGAKWERLGKDWSWAEDE